MNSNLKYIIPLILSLFFLRTYSQSYPDSLITYDNDTIICEITYVSPYLVYYKVPKGKRTKDKIIGRILIDDLIINSPAVKVKKQKYDSKINGYRRKSKLPVWLDPLYLKSNNSSDLIVLGDSIFSFKGNDYFHMAAEIQYFAYEHRCKLIYIMERTDAERYNVHIRLYDAPESLYDSVFTSYCNNKIYYLRTSHISENEFKNIKVNQSKYQINKNQYLCFEKDSAVDEANAVSLDTSITNETIINNINNYNNYFFVGSISRYDKPTFVLPLPFVGFVVYKTIASGQGNSISNFAGEFMILHTKEQLKE